MHTDMALHTDKKVSVWFYSRFSFLEDNVSHLTLGNTVQWGSDISEYKKLDYRM